SSVASEAWQKLGEAAKASGIPLSSQSSWRTMAHQTRLCNDKEPCRDGTSYSAVAKPGTSNHQAGVAIDIKEIGVGRAASGLTCNNPQTSSSRTYIWLAKGNAARFGIKNYANEAWHWGTAEKCALGV